MTKLALGLSALALSFGAVSGNVEASEASVKPPCVGRSVYVFQGQPTPCDVNPPQRLHVLRSNRTSCDDMGGRFAPLVRICWNVDY